MVKVGKNLWGLSSPTSLLKQGQVKMVVQDRIQLGFEFWVSCTVKPRTGKLSQIACHPVALLCVFMTKRLLSKPTLMLQVLVGGSCHRQNRALLASPCPHAQYFVRLVPLSPAVSLQAIGLSAPDRSRGGQQCQKVAMSSWGFNPFVDGQGFWLYLNCPQRPSWWHTSQWHWSSLSSRRPQAQPTTEGFGGVPSWRVWSQASTWDTRQLSESDRCFQQAPQHALKNIPTAQAKIMSPPPSRPGRYGLQSLTPKSTFHGLCC